MKRPAFQFYPADWRKDVELQSCSMAAQGFWINVMCIAQECEPYGHLMVNGRGMTAAQMGRQVGLNGKEAQALLDELIDAGVARRTSEGLVYSKRMVDDERIRNIRAEAGRLGGNPALVGKKVNQKDNQTANLDLTPSSSSSSSSSNTPKTPKGAGTVSKTSPRFDRFWQAYPKKVGKDDAAKVFAKRNPDDELLGAMLASIAVQKRTDQWAKDGGQFIPNPATWLNQGRWQDEVQTEFSGGDMYASSAL